MGLSDLAAVGSFVSGVAVVVTLGFLLLQMRQANANQRALLNQGAMAHDNAIMAILQEPGVATVLTRAQYGETAFKPVELWRLNIALRAVLGQLQDVQVQRKAGLIDQVTYDFVEAGVQYIVCLPLVRAIWIDARHSVSADTATIVDQLIARTPLWRPIDQPALIKSRIEDLARP